MPAKGVSHLVTNQVMASFSHLLDTPAKRETRQTLSIEQVHNMIIKQNHITKNIFM